MQGISAQTISEHKMTWRVRVVAGEFFMRAGRCCKCLPRKTTANPSLVGKPRQFYKQSCVDKSRRNLLHQLVFFRKKPPENLYYAFPDTPEGSRARYFRNVKWAIAVGIFFAAIIGGAIYFLNTL
jgi:hypothetical protein